jgi:RHS repeat-associated protein
VAPEGEAAIPSRLSSPSLALVKLSEKPSFLAELPFGEECNPQPGNQPLRFTGKERDIETGFDYFGARYYRAEIGRFTTVDPAMDFKASLLNPQKWNKYAYALNNPLRYVDPDGRQEAHAGVWAERRNIQDAFGPVGVAEWQGRNTQAAGVAAGVAAVIWGGVNGPALGLLEASRATR